MPTFWSVIDVPDLQSAAARLGVREYPEAGTNWIERNIGFWDRARDLSRGLEGDTIAEWAKTQGLAGAVWTNLPTKLNGRGGVTPSEEEVIAYLSTFKGETRDRAEAYIRKTPKQVDATYRRRIVRQLGRTAMTDSEDCTRIHAGYPIVCRGQPTFKIVPAWLPILETALGKLEAIGITQTGRGEKALQVIAIYEKYGTLRIEADSLAPEVEAILLEAEDSSEVVARG